MPKSHTVKLSITNNTAYAMNYSSDWFDSGRLADNTSWPRVIESKDHADNIECYEKDNSLTGCSGYVQYSLSNLGSVTIAFSNPSVGNNKLGVGVTGKEVWEKMSDHDYKTFKVTFTLGEETFTATCKCSGGSTNNCTVTIA